MWPLSLMMSAKQVPAEAEPAPKVCRVCWGGDEGGEEWVAPCHCPRTVAWVHRSCLAWRLKHTPSEEDKLRCAVCKFAYKKSLRLKSLREWFDGWREDCFVFCLDLGGLLGMLFALFCFHNRTTMFEEDPWWLAALMVYVYIPALILMALLAVVLHLYVAYHLPQRFGLALYKRFMAVAVRDWVLDAPPPPQLPREGQVQDGRRR